MSDLPQPLVPAEVDLRGYEFMPLFGDRLFASETWIAASPEARCAMLRLWWHAYGHELPAASLPENDQMLSEYAGYGVAVKAWLKIRPQAMRGWIKCNDGRWYHSFVTELAMEAWERRKAQRDRTEKARQARLLQSQLQNKETPVTESTGQDRTGQEKIGQERTSKTKHKGNGSAQAPFVLPEWIPEEHWLAWVEARTKARKPITDYAKRLAVRKLENFRERGHPPAQVLMRSAMNGWADLFEPKEA